MSFISSDKIDSEEIPIQNYITTDNLLQNKQGYTPYNDTLSSDKVVAYKAGDILISNIRPYLRKIWLADKTGGCSADVIVLRLLDNQVLPKFFYYSLAQDSFFDYVMKGVKGVKMPRGDKSYMMKYKMYLPSLDKQVAIISEIEGYEAKIAEAQAVIDSCSARKTAILNKYLM